MKKLLATIGVAALLLATITHAAPLFELNLPTNSVSQLTFAAYPGYAPDLKLEDGTEAPWGAGVALLYPVGTPYTLIGARMDWLADEFWAPSIDVTLQVPVKILGVPVTPIAIGGAIMPLGGGGEENHEVGAITGAGAYVTVWRPTAVSSLQVFYLYEHWWLNTQDIGVHRPGLAFTLKF